MEMLNQVLSTLGRWSRVAGVPAAYADAEQPGAWELPSHGIFHLACLDLSGPQELKPWQPHCHLAVWLGSHLCYQQPSQGACLATLGCPPALAIGKSWKRGKGISCNLMKLGRSSWAAAALAPQQQPWFTEQKPGDCACRFSEVVRSLGVGLS